MTTPRDSKICESCGESWNHRVRKCRSCGCRVFRAPTEQECVAYKAKLSRIEATLQNLMKDR